MRVPGLVTIVLSFAVIGNAQRTTPISGELTTLHQRCLEAGERAEKDARAMVPRRSWTWKMDAERSLQRLGEMRRHLEAFRDTEARFDASLAAEQSSKLASQLRSMRELFEHIDKDAQSLEDELRKGEPTRWHVAHDATDMEKEIHRWRQLHQQIATAVGH